MTARTKKKEGVTLIELVMVIVAVGVIVGVATMYINEVVDLWSFMSFRTDVVNQARLSVARMSREMRQVKNATSVQAAEAHRFQFTDINDQPIDYYLSGTDLRRNADTLAGGVRNLTFGYYNATGEVLAVPVDAGNRTQIRRVSVFADIAAGTESKSLETQVFLRNSGN